MRLPRLLTRLLSLASRRLCTGVRVTCSRAAVADALIRTDFESFIETWRNRGLAGSPCTSVWTAGAIAYRCRTCQVPTATSHSLRTKQESFNERCISFTDLRASRPQTNDSSAICVTCFKAGGHEVRPHCGSVQKKAIQF